MLTLDSTSQEFLKNPWPLLKRFREEAPIWWSDKERLFYVFRHEHIEKIFMDQRFTVEYPWRTTRHLFGPTLIDMEGEEQTRLKKLVSSTVLSSENNKRFAQEFALPTIEKLIDGVVYQPVFDFIEEVANRVPTLMTCQFLGIPLEYERWLFEKMMILMNHLGESSVNYDIANKMRREVDEWLTDFLRKQSFAGQGSKRYLQMFESIRHESMETKKIIFWTFLAGGIETSMCLLGNALVVLSQHPNWFARLGESTSLARSILTEVLRFEPVQGSTVRFATEDLEIGDTKIKRNQCVKLVLTSACRDEAVFKDADIFDPARPTSKNLAFAIGSHACMGRNFTLTNAEITLRLFWEKLQGVRQLEPITSTIYGSMFRRPVDAVISSKIESHKACTI